MTVEYASKTSLTTRRYVDTLGGLKAQIANLNDTADTIKALLIGEAAATGESAFEGFAFRASVSFADKRKTDWASVVAALQNLYDIPDARIDRLIAAHTEVAEGVPTVRVSARKGA